MFELTEYRRSLFTSPWPDAAAVLYRDSPNPIAFLAYCIPECMDGALEGSFMVGAALGPLAGWELVGLTCREPSIQSMGHAERAEVLEIIVCCGAQFVGWLLGGTLQALMTKSGLEANPSVTKGVVS